MKQNSRRKLNNVGMSLVEIIVVVLILGILSAGGVVGLAYINSMDAESAADNTMSMLNRTRLNTISAAETANVQMQLYKDDNHYYAKLLSGGEEVETVELGRGGLTIKVKDTSNVYHNVASGAITFTYQKSNGAFNCPYTEIMIEGSDTVTIFLVNATGRCFMQ